MVTRCSEVEKVAESMVVSSVRLSLKLPVK